MIQQPLNNQVKSPRLAFGFICTMVFVQLLLHLVCFPFFTHESLQFLKTVTVLSFALLALNGFLSWLRGPGFIKRMPEVTMTELLDNFEMHEICFEC